MSQNTSSIDPSKRVTPLVPLDRLKEIAKNEHKTYINAHPFPHASFDNFLDANVLDAALNEFPGPEDIKWSSSSTYQETKLSCSDEEIFGPATRRVIHFLNSSAFIGFLEELTGIEGLIADPHYLGGGLHQIMPGGKLAIHADFNKYPRLKLDRRLNVLVYLNKDWDEAWGGHFELWDTEMKGCVKKFAPLFNRLVVFSTTDKSYHGHPDPLNCPPERSRRSIALYYYTNGRPKEEDVGRHSTIFKLRPGEVIHKSMREKIKNWIIRLTPPIVFEIRDSLRWK